MKFDLSKVWKQKLFCIVKCICTNAEVHFVKFSFCLTWATSIPWCSKFLPKSNIYLPWVIGQAYIYSTLLPDMIAEKKLYYEQHEELNKYEGNVMNVCVNWNWLSTNIQDNAILFNKQYCSESSVTGLPQLSNFHILLYPSSIFNASFHIYKISSVRWGIGSSMRNLNKLM